MYRGKRNRDCDLVFEFLYNIFFGRLFIRNYVNQIIWLLFAHIFTRSDKKIAENI